jgi:glycosyltransferase involved in cell wall biosynthesis
MIGKQSKFILVLSNATPHYVLSVMNSELNVGKFPIKYFGRSLPHLQELRSFESSCDTAHRIVVPSDFVKSSFQELSEKMDVSKIRVIRLGFDQEIFSQIVLAEPRTDRLIVNRPFQVIFVGQICSRKGVGYLVHAFQQANLPIDSTLTLVGNSINGFADFLIANSTNIRHISFTNQWELNQLYRDMDLFVMPSLIEGFCLSAIEAMGYGIPVLVSPETIDNIQTNQFDGLTATGANVETLRLQLEWAFKNPVKLTQIGVKGALLAKNYSWDLYGEKFKIFLGELAEQEQTGIS